MVEGRFIGLDAAIYPVQGRYLGVELTLGVNHIAVNHLRCNSFTYDAGTGQLLSASYELDKSSNWGFSYGVALHFTLYRQLRGSLFARLPEAMGDGNGSYFLTGIGLRYTLN